MRIATYNLRYDSQPDHISVAQTLAALPDPLDGAPYLGKKGEQPWSTRRIHVAQHILEAGVDVLAVQEALVRQVHDIAELLGKDWAWEGIGRDDGVEKGEFCAMFYKKAKFKVSSVEHFWLSDTPFIPSKYPGAGSYRICTSLHLTLRRAFWPLPWPWRSCTVTLLNAHLDDQSDAQRALGASLLLVRARHATYSSRAPVFVVGDLNSPPTGPSSRAYQILTGAVPPLPVAPDFAVRYATPREADGFFLADLLGAVPRARVSATHATFTGFGAPEDTEEWERLDFVLGGSNGGWRADAYTVGTSLTDDGVLASDHRPVFADVSLVRVSVRE